VGLIARDLEAAGISTVCMGSALDIMQAVNPPRGAFLDFPLGHTTGKPGNREEQRAIILAALAAFTELTEPGHITRLPFRWDADDAWKRDAMSSGDLRIPRLDTPQYQCEEDRIAAEHAATDCGPCGGLS
jgi:hypothetical protein